MAQTFEQDASALAQAHNTIEDQRVGARREVEGAARSHAQARHALAENLIKAQGNLDDETVRSTARLVMETARVLELAKAREDSFSKAVVLVQKAISKHYPVTAEVLS